MLQHVVYSVIDISHNIILPQDKCIRVVYSVISGMRGEAMMYSIEGSVIYKKLIRMQAYKA